MVLPSPRESAAPTPGRAPCAATRSLMIRGENSASVVALNVKLASGIHDSAGTRDRRRIPVANPALAVEWASLCETNPTHRCPRVAVDCRQTQPRRRRRAGPTSRRPPGFSRRLLWARAARRRGDGPRAARTRGRKRRRRLVGSPIYGGERAARSRAGGDRPRTRNSTSSRTGNASGSTISTPTPRWCVTPITSVANARGDDAPPSDPLFPELGTPETVGPASVFTDGTCRFFFHARHRATLNDVSPAPLSTLTCLSRLHDLRVIDLDVIDFDSPGP